MVEQYLVTSWIIFSWLLLALVGKVASFVGKVFVVRAPTTKTTNILSPPGNYQLYGTKLFQKCQTQNNRARSVVTTVVDPGIC